MVVEASDVLEAPSPGRCPLQRCGLGLSHLCMWHPASPGQTGVASRLNHEVTLLLIDVDHFKLVNDQRGHAAGDRVLAAVGRLLREQVRDYDLVAREPTW